MAETEAIEKQFSGVDALIARAAAETKGLRADADEAMPELNEQERRDVEAALKLAHGDHRAVGCRSGSRVDKLPSA
ncbi:hypothetical protein [Streptomyces shenzhenensis]|uniref:hypothetical protein n=1 Tax=Streptomyces shenzhenensis TaxID=943815 RepID=UPI001C690D50|nr:hypothetical protein [Streptomyces shenzhenensis]